METTDLLKKVRQIEIKTRGLSNNIFAGQYHSAFKGRGMAFSEVREYQFGDDIRDIDWNVTARFHKPFVKVFEEERELTVMLLVDVSGSLEFGTVKQMKKDMVTEIAATLAFSAIQNNDKIGVIFFSDRIEKFIPPKKGRKHILYIIRELLDFRPESRRTNIRLGLEYLTNVMKRRCTAFVLSDFIDQESFKNAMTIANRKHDVVAIQVYDRRVEELPAVGLMKIKDAETGHEQWIDTSSRAVRRAHRDWWVNKQTELNDTFTNRRMKRYLFLITLLTALTGRVIAQSVTVDATIDSLQILIGEQAKIKLQVSLDTDKRAILPAYTDTLVRGVEIVDIAKPDTQMLNDGRRSLITQEYTVTSFDSALYYLPPMEVLVDNKAYRSKALALKVYSMPVDTLHPDQFFGPKPVMKAPFAWEDWYMSIACAVLFVPFLLLLIYLVKRIRDNKPIIRKVKVEPKLPPHQLAMQEIERIKGEKVWQKGQSKEYYTELTDAIRTYIKDRFGFNALEMTSSEIIDKLLEMNDKNAISDLRILFQTADLVKFAKHNPLMNENDANLINAIDFINETKEKEDENAKPQPTEITIIEKRSLRTKILLGAGIVALTAALVGSLIYIGLELYNYFA